MLYSIIPPILIILSLAGIILFVVKKLPFIKKEIEKNPLPEEVRGKDFFLKVKAFFKNFFIGIKSVIFKIKNKIFSKEKKEYSGIDEKINFDLKEDSEEKPENFQEQEQKYFQFLKKDEKKIDEEALVKKPLEEKKFEKKDLFEKILIDRIATNPKDVEAYERLGEYYLEIESWNDAKECLKQVLKLNPRNVNARSKMRRLERLLGK